MALSDELFESIDTIVKARIANLPYDQTIECEIINIDKADQGIYLVQSQISNFEVKGEKNNFNIGDIVYVQIPQNDYKKEKTIISKKTPLETIEEKATSKPLPFTTVYYDPSISFMTNDTLSKIVEIKPTSRGRTEKEIITVPIIEPIIGFDKLAFKCSVECDIEEKVLSGAYGITFYLTGYNQSQVLESYEIGKQQQQTYEFTLSTDEGMLGINLFKTFGQINQQQVFDIHNLIITDLKIKVWQDGNFKLENNAQIYSSIKFYNFELYVGYDKKLFQNKEKIIYLFTQDGLLYDRSNINKTIKAKIIKKDINNQIKNLDENDFTYIYTGILTIFDQNDNKYDTYTENSQLFNYHINLDYSATEKQIKVNLLLKNDKEEILSNDLIFTNAVYISDSNMADYLLDNEDRVMRNLKKIVAALKEIKPDLDITLE